jgi:Asp-tRNA(Asn)/Glu-tRNA(Gln) amidotransferase A subunit family amidase
VLEEATIADARAAMTSGQLTARQLVQQYLDRIGALDRAGPQLHALLETNPEALALADALDAERRITGPRGPLNGIPIVIKEKSSNNGTTLVARSPDFLQVLREETCLSGSSSQAVNLIERGISSSALLALVGNHSLDRRKGR